MSKSIFADPQLSYLQFSTTESTRAAGSGGHASAIVHKSPWVSFRGGGDDFGVFITASPSAGIKVGPQLAPGQKAGPDALAIMRSLYAMPGFRNFAAIER